MILKKGEPIIFPTDTVYGIGALIHDIDAQDKIIEIKKRDANKRFLVLCANLAQVEEIAIVNENFYKLAAKFLPGALTIILPSKDHVIGKYIDKTIGIRIPNHKQALELLNEFGPLATTSLNLSGESPLFSKEEIMQKYQDLGISIYLDEEISKLRLPSTIVSLIHNEVTILREGEIAKQDIFHVLKN